MNTYFFVNSYEWDSCIFTENINEQRVWWLDLLFSATIETVVPYVPFCLTSRGRAMWWHISIMSTCNIIMLTCACDLFMSTRSDMQHKYVDMRLNLISLWTKLWCMLTWFILHVKSRSMPPYSFQNCVNNKKKGRSYIQCSRQKVVLFPGKEIRCFAPRGC